MKVLMFGWEFPPLSSGGLGTACMGLTKGLKNHNVDVIFVMPKVPSNIGSGHVDLVSAADVMIRDEHGHMKDIIEDIIEIDSPLTPYMTNEEYKEKLKSMPDVNVPRSSIVFSKSTEMNSIYGQGLFNEVWRYRMKSRLVAMGKEFDVIHCHDWMTYGAGIEAKKVSGKPLVMHIHATEFDRTGNNPNPYVYNLEKEGFENADKILAVSNFTRNTVIDHYGIDPGKIDVVHNAVEFTNYNEKSLKIASDDKVVLFLGRITIQKGPDWFLYTARKVLDYYPNAKFVIAGSGDMHPFIIHKAAELGMADKVLFAGFLKGTDIDRAYKMADLYVMPSISEPFGITPLESMRNGTPVLISKQSGVSEVISHCLKADFWDIDDMANKIIGVLEHSSLHKELQTNGKREVLKFNWNDPAKKCLNAYNSVIDEYNRKKDNNSYGGILKGY